MILTATPAAKFAVIKHMTERDNNILNLSWLCELAGVSRAGYYKWLKAEKNRSNREQRDKDDFELILAAYKHRGFDKGARGIHMRLLHLKPPVIMNVKKIRRLMTEFNLFCPIRKLNPHRQLARQLQTSRTAPNLLARRFRAFGPRKVLLTDITYIPRDVNKFSYLSVIMDAYTKEILAYAFSPSLEVDFVLLTVNRLIEKHGHELETDVLIHSDQSCHYTSNSFIEILGSLIIRQSMSRRANCWDNAPQESLFGHMKDVIRIKPRDKHDDIAAKIDDWVDYYNNERHQWRLAKLSPSEFYLYTITGIYPLPAEMLVAKEDNMTLTKKQLLVMAHNMRVGLTDSQISDILARFNDNDGECCFTEQDIAEQVRNYCQTGEFVKCCAR